MMQKLSFIKLACAVFLAIFVFWLFLAALAGAIFFTYGFFSTVYLLFTDGFTVNLSIGQKMLAVGGTMVGAICWSIVVRMFFVTAKDEIKIIPKQP
jgi:uncharacterized membrane protein